MLCYFLKHLSFSFISSGLRNVSSIEKEIIEKNLKNNKTSVHLLSVIYPQMLYDIKAVVLIFSFQRSNTS